MIKKIALVLIIVIGGFAIFLWIIDKPKPTGQEGPEAEALAMKMVTAMNKDAWDTTYIIQWTFKGIHTFQWDKKRNYVKVTWDDKEVLLDINSKKGKVFIDGQESEDELLVWKAWEYFANDSFWLAAHYKIFDPGTSRAIVDTDEGTALLVHYSSGGVTPGDSYLWYLDEDGQPYKWQMWVQMIPVGGLSFTWQDWKRMPSGIMIPQNHRGVIEIPITNLSTANTLADLNGGVDPFEIF